MTLLTPAVYEALCDNVAQRRDALIGGLPDPDQVPVVKLFNPRGFAIWLAVEIASDGATLFGLADLGFGFPELSSFSLSKIRCLRLPRGLRIERDFFFATQEPLSVWAEAAHRTGSILCAYQQLKEQRYQLPS